MLSQLPRVSSLNQASSAGPASQILRATRRLWVGRTRGAPVDPVSAAGR
jgi:hypothetical protein